MHLCVHLTRTGHQSAGSFLGPNLICIAGVMRSLRRLGPFIAVVCAGFADRVHAGAGNGIEESPSWRVSSFLFLFLLLSTILEHALEHLEHWLHRKELMGWLGALHNVKDELMLLGFISLLLMIFENDIAKICLDDKYWVGVKCKYPASAPAPSPSRRRGVDPACAASASAPAASAPAPVPAPAPGAPFSILFGYNTTVAAPVPAPAPAPGRRLLVLPCDEEPKCAVGTTGLLEVAAMHDVHHLIFMIAIVHISFSAITLLLAQSMFAKWRKWEVWGDAEDGSETIQALRPPIKFKSRVEAHFYHVLSTITRMVTPFDYIAFRRYYVYKNNKRLKIAPEKLEDFELKSILDPTLQVEFENFVGMSSWMYLVLLFEVFAEGYGFGKYYFLNLVSLAVNVLVGMKANSISYSISRGVLEAFTSPDHITGKMDRLSQVELDHIQGFEPTNGVSRALFDASDAMSMSLKHRQTKGGDQPKAGQIPCKMTNCNLPSHAKMQDAKEVNWKPVLDNLEPNFWWLGGILLVINIVYYDILVVISNTVRAIWVLGRRPDDPWLSGPKLLVQGLRFGLFGASVVISEVR